MRLKGNESVCKLFAVQGFEEGEYDPAIPRYWLDVPPTSLSGNDKVMEALRVGKSMKLFRSRLNQNSFSMVRLFSTEKWSPSKNVSSKPRYRIGKRR